jgi:hypothetical protein
MTLKELRDALASGGLSLLTKPVSSTGNSTGKQETAAEQAQAAQATQVAASANH